MPAAITVTLPLILEPGERLTNRPSLAAGNDPTRPFDLETDRRVAEFKVGIWSGNGTDAMRKRTIFHDLVHLAADTSNRRPELYVVGHQPVRFLQRSRTTAQWALDRGAASTRQPFVERFGDLGTTVEQSVAGPAEHVRIVDLADLLPEPSRHASLTPQAPTAGRWHRPHLPRTGSSATGTAARSQPWPRAQSVA